MTSKSATPSGSQRARTPAPSDERPWFKADIDAWALVRDRLPRPWPSALCMEDLKHLAARERFCRVAWDGQTALQERWGVSASTVKRYLAAARSKAGPDLDQTWTKAEPADSENAQQTLILEAPKSESESESKNTIKPAKAGGVSLEDIQAMLDEMHAIAKAVEPGARRQTAQPLSAAVLRTLKALAPTARARKTTTRALILDLWRWWWSDDNKWLREKRPGSKGYTTMFRPCNVENYLVDSDNWRAARYIPTADEALDAVLEVGCGAAEQRYPAGAKAIRQTFDFEMSGDLNRMRNHSDPAKVRARWSAGYAKYLTPKLSLVAR